MGKNMKGRWIKRAILTTAFLLCFNSPAAEIATAAADYMPKELIPSGMTVGLSVESDGVMIVSLSEVETREGKVNPAAEAGLMTGDVIKNVGSADIDSIEDFKRALENAKGNEISVRVERNGKLMQFSVRPKLSLSGAYELGVWLRDGVTGMGTLTFIDPKTGVFGILGHPVSDIDTKVIMPLRCGLMTEAKVSSITKGRSGAPGQLQGNIDPDKVLGKLYANTHCGVFGIAEKPELIKGRALPVAAQKEIRVGDAVLLSNLNGGAVEEYKIKISRIYTAEEERSMLITVTDERLISKTGGIVQGMSGSPILQNGKIIGAVTHVLVNEPTKGYAISIDKMLDEAFMVKQKMAA